MARSHPHYFGIPPEDRKPHKYTITLITDNQLIPGNSNHIGAILMNPSTKNVTIECEELPREES